MYRGDESMNPQPDQDAMLGEWKKAFTSKIISPNGTLEPEADFSTPENHRPCEEAPQYL